MIIEFRATYCFLLVEEACLANCLAKIGLGTLISIKLDNFLRESYVLFNFHPSLMSRTRKTKYHEKLWLTMFLDNKNENKCKFCNCFTSLLFRTKHLSKQLTSFVHSLTLLWIFSSAIFLKPSKFRLVVEWASTSSPFFKSLHSCSLLILVIQAYYFYLARSEVEF